MEKILRFYLSLLMTRAGRPSDRPLAFTFINYYMLCTFYSELCCYIAAPPHPHQSLYYIVFFRLIIWSIQLIY